MRRVNTCSYEHIEILMADVPHLQDNLQNTVQKN